MGKHHQGIDNKIKNRIYGHGKGWVFTPAHFADLGSRDAVASALKRYRKSGLIRQIARSLYDYPEKDPELGTLSPTPEAVAKALAGRDAVRLQPSGAYAANLLGLSTQMPMKIVYLTDGLSRTIAIGKKQIILKRTTPRNMATAGRISGLVIQALRHLGKEYVGDDIFFSLDCRLDDDDRKQLLKALLSQAIAEEMPAHLSWRLVLDPDDRCGHHRKVEVIDHRLRVSALRLRTADFPFELLEAGFNIQRAP